MKTLLVTVPNGTVISSLLQTGCVTHWAKTGLKVVLMVPNHIRQALEKHYGSERVVFETYQSWDYPPFHAVLSLVARASLSKRHRLKTLDLLERYNARVTSSPWRMNLWALTPPSRWLENLCVRLMKSFAPRLYAGVFLKHRPDAVFFNNPYMPAELPVVAEACRRGVRQLALCHSWDNLTSRGPMPFTPDRFYVWNRVNAEEAIKMIPGLGRDKVEVVGIPLFDIYANRAAMGDRESFMTTQGLNPSKKLISVMGVTERSCPIQSQLAYVEDLVAAIRDGRLANCQVYFRMHPKMRTGETAEWGRRLGIVCCFPRTDEVFDDGWVPGDDDLMLQARTVVFSDLCINVASSMTIHCAITGNKVLSPSFDHVEGLSYDHSVRRVYDYEHNVKMHRLGFVKVVEKRADFIPCVQESLMKPLDEAARQRVLSDYAGNVDGRAAQRLADSVLRELAV